MTIEDLKGKISSLLDQYERESSGCIIIEPSNPGPLRFYEWNGESFQEESAQNIGKKILNSAGVETKVRVFWSDDLWCVTDNKYDDRPLRCWRRKKNVKIERG